MNSIQLTRRQRLVIGHLVFLSGTSILFWMLFQTSIAQPESAAILKALLAASALFSWVLVGLLLWREPAALWIGIVCIVAPVLFWGFDTRAYFGLLAAVFCFWAAAREVSRETEDRLSFSSGRSFAVAKQMGVLGFSILISIGYFLSIRTLSWEDLVSRFELRAGTVEKMATLVGYVQPELAELGQDSRTVDEYLRSLNGLSFLNTPDEALQFEQLNNQVGRLREQGINIEFTGDALTLVRGAAEESSLASGRQQLGELAGRTVSGDEQVSALFAEGLEKKIFAIVEGSQMQERIPDRTLPVFIALLFFLTVWPLALLLFSLWSFMAALCIGLFRSWQWIEISRHAALQDRLEL